jgi:carboxymethylenebutenolidase
MCFDHDSRPPITPIAGGAVDAGVEILTGRDGTRSRAFRARAAEPTGAAIVVLPDVRGLHPYYEELALRFAERGVDALAVDYFGRTAGVEARGADFDHTPHVGATTYEGLAADVRTAVAALRTGGIVEDGARRSIFTVGFCFGGRLSFLAATLDLDLTGVIGFYGVCVGPPRNGMPAPADVAGSMAAPVLGLFGGADPAIPADTIDAFDAALTRAGVEHEIVTYPGAPHSFFDRKAADFTEASAAAWDRMLEFIAHHGDPGTRTAD